MKNYIYCSNQYIKLDTVIIGVIMSDNLKLLTKKVAIFLNCNHCDVNYFILTERENVEHIFEDKDINRVGDYFYCFSCHNTDFDYKLKPITNSFDLNSIKSEMRR